MLYFGTEKWEFTPLLEHNSKAYHTKHYLYLEHTYKLFTNTKVTYTKLTSLKRDGTICFWIWLDNFRYIWKGIRRTAGTHCKCKKKQHNKKFSFCTLQVCLTFEFRNEFFGFEKVTLSTSRNGRTQGTEIIFHCLSVLFQVLGVFV
jgi:hypothetical protein